MLYSFSSQIYPRLNTLKIATIIAIVAASCAGCQSARHKQLPEGEIHRITREFVFAANSSAPSGSEIHGEVGAFDKVTNSADHVEIRIFEKREGTTYPPSVVPILQKLGAIAMAHDLTQDTPTENGNAIVVNYRHAGFISHIVHIHLLGSDEASEQGSAPPTSENLTNQLRLVFVSVLGP